MTPNCLQNTRTATRKRLLRNWWDAMWGWSIPPRCGTSRSTTGRGCYTGGVHPSGAESAGGGAVIRRFAGFAGWRILCRATRCGASAGASTANRPSPGWKAPPTRTGCKSRPCWTRPWRNSANRPPPHRSALPTETIWRGREGFGPGRRCRAEAREPGAGEAANIFARRGVSSTTAVIAGAISANSVQTAPAVLAKAVTAIAVTKGAAASGSTLTIVKGALKIMAWTKAKTAIVVGASVLLAAGTATTFVVQHKFHSPLPQIHIKARFVEISKGSDDFLNSSPGFTGILEPSSARTLLRTLESKPGVHILSEPEVTTLSGRQTQMRSTQIITIITNSIFEETKSAGSITPQTGQVEIGPTLDVVPAILANSRIQITTTAFVTYFLGYADSSKLTPHYATNSAGEQIPLPIYLPAFQIKKAMTNDHIG